MTSTLRRLSIRTVLCSFMMLGALCGTAAAQTSAEKLSAARSYRLDALRTAHNQLTRLRQQVAQGRPAGEYDATVLRRLKEWMFLNAPAPGDMGFVAQLDKLIAIVRDFREAPMAAAPEPAAANACAAEVRRTGKYAFALTIGGRIYFCEPWVNKGPECRRIVLIHEHFHAVGGISDVFGSNSGRGAPTTTAQALQCPDYLAGLVSQLHSGNSDRCDR